MKGQYKSRGRCIAQEGRLKRSRKQECIHNRFMKTGSMRRIIHLRAASLHYSMNCPHWLISSSPFFFEKVHYSSVWVSGHGKDFWKGSKIWSTLNTGLKYGKSLVLADQSTAAQHDARQMVYISPLWNFDHREMPRICH